MPLKFEGIVRFRSSASPLVGPPGETQILALNPERATRILTSTGWDRLEPGSLNLEVPHTVIDALATLIPQLVEDAATISYPPPYEHIPSIRKAYWYYRAIAKAPGRRASVLVRRAQVPVLGTVELFAPLHLVRALSLSASSKVRVEVHAP